MTVSGHILGVRKLFFRPSVTEFRDDLGRVFFTNSIVVEPDSKSWFSVDLFDGEEVRDPRGLPWRWICTEHVSRVQEFKFAFAPRPGGWDYALLRPIGGGL
jgi:hypothetical protein